MLPSALALAYRREERVQKAFSGDGDAPLRVRATPSQGRKMRLQAVKYTGGAQVTR